LLLVSKEQNIQFQSFFHLLIYVRKNWGMAMWNNLTSRKYEMSWEPFREKKTRSGSIFYFFFFLALGKDIHWSLVILFISCELRNLHNKAVYQKFSRFLMKPLRLHYVKISFLQFFVFARGKALVKKFYSAILQLV
jgi:hypothetical protein